MSKKLLQDMVKKKSSRVMMTRKTQVMPIKEIHRPEKEVSLEYVSSVKSSKNRNRYMLWFVAIISVVFFLLALSFLFSKGKIVLNPKTQDIVLNENLSATKDSSNDGMLFNLVDNISGEENETIPANAQKDISNKATGTVVIFNAFSSSPQPLNIDTRLVASNGKIYKTQKKIIVPGMNKDGTFGQAEVGIYANVAGPEYNSAPLDFTIFGFKGTPKYSKFKVRTKTGTSITGGFIGKVSVISDADKASALIKLNSSLKTQLLTKVINQIPNGFILFKDAIILNTEDPVIPLTADQNNNFTITLRGTLYGFIFNEQKLTQKIVGDNLDKYDGSDVYISNLKDLTFSLSNKDNISIGDLQKIDFNLSGAAKIVWRLDENKLIADLLGKSKKDFNQILLQYPNIDSADLTVSPFWRMSLPDKTKDIKVIVNYPK